MLRLNPALGDYSICTPDGTCYFDDRKTLCVHTRNLPHWRQEGATYFVTFRQIDSIPVTVWDQMKREAVAWNARIEEATQQHGAVPPSLNAEWEAFQRRQWIHVERTADECHGSCVLLDSTVRQIMSDALAFFEGQRHFMHAFVVMPNHVHFLMEIDRGRIGIGTGRDLSVPNRALNQSNSESLENSIEIFEKNEIPPIKIKSISSLLGAFKTTSSKQIHLAGNEDFAWHRSFHDNIVRNSEAFRNIDRYITNNPKKWDEDKFNGKS